MLSAERKRESEKHINKVNAEMWYNMTFSKKTGDLLSKEFHKEKVKKSDLLNSQPMRSSRILINQIESNEHQSYNVTC